MVKFQFAHLILMSLLLLHAIHLITDPGATMSIKCTCAIAPSVKEMKIYNHKMLVEGVVVVWVVVFVIGEELL